MPPKTGGTTAKGKARATTTKEKGKEMDTTHLPTQRVGGASGSRPSNSTSSIPLGNMATSHQTNRENTVSKRNGSAMPEDSAASSNPATNSTKRRKLDDNVDARETIRMSTNKQTTIRTDVEAGTVPEETDNEPIGDTDDDDDESEVDEYAEAKAHLARDPVGTVWEALLNLTQIAADKTREAKDLEARVTAPVQQTVNNKAAELKDIIGSNVSRIVELVTKNDAATRQRLAQLANERAAKDAREAEREKRDDERDRRLADLEAALRANTERSTKDTDARIAALENSLRDKTSHIAELVSEREKRDAELETNKRRIAELEAEAAHRAHIEPTSSDIERDQRMARFEAALRANIETTTSARINEIENSDLEAALSANTETTTNARINELENSISDKTARIDELVSDRETKDRRIAELEDAARANVVSTSKDTERRLADLEAAVRTHGESTTKNKDTRIAELQDNIGDKKLRIADLSKQLADKDARIAAFESNISSLTTRNSQLSSKLAEKDARIAEDDTKIAQLELELRREKQRVENQKETIRWQQEKITKLESTIQTEKKRTSKLESTIQTATKKTTSLESTLGSERRKAEEQQVASDNRIAKLRGTITKLKKPSPFWMRPADEILAHFFNNPVKPAPIPDFLESDDLVNNEVRMLKMGFTCRRMEEYGQNLFFE